MQGLIGKKIGMTRVFDGSGAQVPVTVIQAGPCVVVQRKTGADGYEAVQLGFQEKTEKRATKALQGHCKKAADRAQAVPSRNPVGGWRGREDRRRGDRSDF